MTDNPWQAVEDSLYHAKGITFDTCHKIYLIMSDEQMSQMKEYGYSIWKVESEATALDILENWYSNSCSLRFIESVGGTANDPTFESLIPQGYEWEMNNA